MTFDLAKAERRAREMSDGQLLSWLEVAVPGMQRHLETYQRTGSLDHLGEFVIAQTTAHIVTQELMERKFGLRHAASVPSEPPKASGTTSARKGFLRRRQEPTGTATVPRTGTR